MARPYAATLPHFNLPVGPFLTHSQLLDIAAFNRSVTYEQIDKACERLERHLLRGAPDGALDFERPLHSLEVA